MPYYQCQLHHKCNRWNVIDSRHYASCHFKKDIFDRVTNDEKEEIIKMVRLYSCTESIQDILNSLVVNNTKRSWD